MVRTRMRVRGSEGGREVRGESKGQDSGTKFDN